MSEWLEADGRGAYASGTVSGIRTRRYHALLMTATSPPTGRVALVNGVEAWLEIGSAPDVFAGVVDPHAGEPEAVLPARGEHDVVAGLGEPHGRRRPDPAACPGDHGCSLHVPDCASRGGSLRWPGDP